jgi:hypothetical protein
VVLSQAIEEAEYPEWTPCSADESEVVLMPLSQVGLVSAKAQHLILGGK